MSLLLTYSNYTILLGDFNANHIDWGCSTTNPKGAQLLKWINDNNLIIHNTNMSTSLRSSNTIDLIISNQQRDSIDCTLLSYTCSDHFPIFSEFSNILFQCKYEISIPKTYWNVFQAVLNTIHEHIDELYTNIHDEFSIFLQFQNLLHALKSRVTVWSIQNQLQSTLPPFIRILLKYKHYLQNRYRKTKLENDSLDLRLWSKINKQEILNYKARQWTSFLSKLASSNPKTFCNHVKLLNKKPQKGFSGITDDDNMNIYKTPASILSYFQQHFENRFASPNLDISNKTDIDANDLWQRLITVKNDNSIQEHIKYSDLTFTIQDLHSIIKSLANK
ncbi:unnamed protein product [Rotaria sp. Silwood1]|nr:unnamed protein product [Rotaria sp. Silwood1]